MKLDNIGLDKVLHAVGCWLIGVMVAMAIHLIAPSAVFCGFMGALTAMFAGIWKEVWDLHHGGVCDKYDLAADGVGAVAAFLMALLL